MGEKRKKASWTVNENCFVVSFQRQRSTKFARIIRSHSLVCIVLFNEYRHSTTSRDNLPQAHDSTSLRGCGDKPTIGTNEVFLPKVVLKTADIMIEEYK